MPAKNNNDDLVLKLASKLVQVHNHVLELEKRLDKKDNEIEILAHKAKQHDRDIDELGGIVKLGGNDVNDYGGEEQLGGAGLLDDVAEILPLAMMAAGKKRKGGSLLDDISTGINIANDAGDLLGKLGLGDKKPTAKQKKRLTTSDVQGDVIFT